MKVKLILIIIFSFLVCFFVSSKKKPTLRLGDSKKEALHFAEINKIDLILMPFSFDKKGRIFSYYEVSETFHLWIVFSGDKIESMRIVAFDSYPSGYTDPIVRYIEKVSMSEDDFVAHFIREKN